MSSRILLLIVAALAAQGDVRDCVCDLANPDIAQLRACSLCVEVEKQPTDRPVYLVKDNDPSKPNRWLALPRAKLDGANPLSRMTAAERLVFWSAAIGKAHELWGDSWAIAMNGDIARRQCHAHAHIGKLLPEYSDAGSDGGAETAVGGYFVDGPAQLPAISDGTGLWFHPVGKKLHVHASEQINEKVLMR